MSLQSASSSLSSSSLSSSLLSSASNSSLSISSSLSSSLSSSNASSPSSSSSSASLPSSPSPSTLPHSSIHPPLRKNSGSDRTWPSTSFQFRLSWPSVKVMPTIVVSHSLMRSSVFIGIEPMRTNGSGCVPIVLPSFSTNVMSKFLCIMDTRSKCTCSTMSSDSTNGVPPVRFTRHDVVGCSSTISLPGTPWKPSLRSGLSNLGNTAS
mmetsp:Transcript_17693/g.62303  ORF Transcript_17693/g.62303 Transcript_17693/m.62303 type:complete len:208 (-) Transcript_17693:2679-3302(-)